MLPQLFASLFGGSILGWLGHALYVRPQQLKGAPAVVATAVQSVENGIVAPVVTGIAQQELQNLSNPAAAVPLPSGNAIGNAVTVAALSAITTALTGPHTIAPAVAPAITATKAALAPAPSMPAPADPDTTSDDVATSTGDTAAPPRLGAAF